ncbi:hypothetical protein MesoLj131b_77130 (plasmid) [Mesorhizobium sp. 131-2-5]|nr:hypothetical protein MesoLj131b_77130 [Mesorhizobium sp. 131-2-5]
MKNGEIQASLVQQNRIARDERFQTLQKIDTKISDVATDPMAIASVAGGHCALLGGARLARADKREPDPDSYVRQEPLWC